MKRIIFLLLLWLLAKPNFATAQDYRFLPEVQVSPDTLDQYGDGLGFTNGKSIAFWGNEIYILWGSDRLAANTSHLFLSRSTDGGISFLPPVRVDTGSLYNNSTWPTLAVDGAGQLFCSFAYEDVSNQRKTLRCAKSTDSGNSFTLFSQVSGSEGIGPSIPSISIGASDQIDITWTDYQDSIQTSSYIYYAKSTDGGASFSTPLVISPRISRLYCGASTIGTDRRGNVHVAWRDDRTAYAQYHVYYAKSTDGGASFLPSIRVDSTGNYSASYPSLAVDSSGGRVFVLYKDRNTGSHQIYLSKSTDGGTSFFGHTRADSLNTSTSDTPNLSFLEPDSLFFVWKQVVAVNYTNAYFRCSSDGGVTFGNIARLHTEFALPGLGYSFVAVPSKEAVYCAWSIRNGANYDVFFAKAIPSGLGVQSVPGSEIVHSLRISPNPFSTRTIFGYQHPSPSPVSLKVYNIAGHMIRELTSGPKPTGMYHVPWDGRDEKGRRVPAGVYLIRLEAGEHKETGRVVLIR